MNLKGPFMTTIAFTATVDQRSDCQFCAVWSWPTMFPFSSQQHYRPKQPWKSSRRVSFCVWIIMCIGFFCPSRVKQAKVFSKQPILESSKLKEFADDNFNFDENGRKFSKKMENTAGKGEITGYEQFLVFILFSKDLNCRHVKTWACLGKVKKELGRGVPLSLCLVVEMLGK